MTDELGRSLVFQYAPGGVGLPAYEGINGSAASGHLVRVMLADGEQVSFNYSKIQNLVSVEYPLGAQGNTGRRYGYQDPLNTSLLTERSDSRGKVFARWKYDELGRAISYRSGSSIRADGSQAGPPNLTLEYSNSDDSDKGETRVVFSNGSTQIYSWRQDETGHIFELVKNAIEVSKGREVEIDRLPNGSNEASDRVQYYPHDVLMVLAVDSLGYPSTIQLTLRRDGSTHILESKYDQVGRLVDVNWQSGMLEDYNVGQTTTIAELRVAFEQIRATGTNQQVLFSALAQKAFMQGTVHEFLGEAGNQLEVGSTITGEELDEARRKESLNGDGSSSQRSSKSDDDADSIPCENPLEDCAALLRVRDYAEVAECAYVDADCDTRFVEANLDDLSIGLEDLHEGSFHAEIFYDKARDEYIVSFAGTDLTSGGDWWNNLEQELGFSSFQYKKAVLLAKRLVENSPDVNFQFVGHSLGGGLATAAASSVGGEATVFNPAALDEESAIGLGVDYGQAQSNTQIYSVVGEILSQAQTDISFMGLPPGTVNSLPKPEFSWIQENLSQNPYSFYQGRLGVLLHLMDSVQQSLSELITRNQCV
ncbi:lipase family protein [Granulosicoccus antarcticus]|uniref:lipase family protein n=1 Tax=Granulosicoccus antarcticus TaxID=437505 RepID=UPI0012FDB6CF|nr:DUF2974 domain-containing protein [Granulosicoccus antarcticus]